MTITEMREKYGDRMLNRAVTEIVIAGLEILRHRATTGNTFDIAVVAIAEDIDASEWNDVRSIIKRSL